MYLQPYIALQARTKVIANTKGCRIGNVDPETTEAYQIEITLILIYKVKTFSEWS